MTTEEQLWRAVKRDVLRMVEDCSGLFVSVHDGTPRDGGKAGKRLERNWMALCRKNPDVAAQLYHGFEQLQLLLSESPASERYQQQLGELLGVVKIGREANPDVQVETLGELVDLGEEAIRGEVDKLDEER
jgi:hypothetical protein